jgi:hypothetical protein
VKGATGLIFLSLGFLLVVSCATAPGPKAGPKPAGTPTPAGKLKPTTGMPESLSGAEKAAAFAERGFGFVFSEADRSSMTSFVAHHGKPLGIERKDIRNRDDDIVDSMATLTYPNYRVAFYNYAKRDLWTPPESQLLFIASVEKGSYPFGIRIGRGKKATLDTFGLETTASDERRLDDGKGRSAVLTFGGGSLVAVLWDYSGE